MNILRVSLVWKIGREMRDFNAGRKKGEILKYCVWLDLDEGREEILMEKKCEIIFVGFKCECLVQQRLWIDFGLLFEVSLLLFRNSKYIFHLSQGYISMLLDKKSIWTVLIQNKLHSNISHLYQYKLSNYIILQVMCKLISWYINLKES